MASLYRLIAGTRWVSGGWVSGVIGFEALDVMGRDDVFALFLERGGGWDVGRFSAQRSRSRV